LENPFKENHLKVNFRISKIKALGGDNKHMKRMKKRDKKGIVGGSAISTSGICQAPPNRWGEGKMG